MTKTHEKGGLDFGTLGSSVVLLSILLACILFTTIKERRLMAPGDGIPLYKTPQDKR